MVTVAMFVTVTDCSTIIPDLSSICKAVAYLCREVEVGVEAQKVLNDMSHQRDLNPGAVIQ